MSQPSFWIDRPVLVTGASGLLGSHLVERLAALSADVVCLVRDWVPQCEMLGAGQLGGVKIVRGDLCQPGLVERVLGEYEVDTVFHLAAQTIVGIANRNPLSTFETNVRGSWMLFEACRRSPSVRQIVFASSDKAYGDQPILPYNEATPLQGRHPYDVSKSCADLIAQSYAFSYNLPVCITRCGNLFGPRDCNWNRLIPGTIRSLMRGDRPVIRSNGQFVRDYFFVEDAVSAYLLTAVKLAGNRALAGEGFNFSNGEPQSVIQVVETLRRLMHSDLEPEVRNNASNEIREQFLDAAKAREMLGWQVEHAFEAGLSKTIRWYEDLLSAGGDDT